MREFNNLKRYLCPRLLFVFGVKLEQHKSRSDCWVSLDGVVYDISSYLRFHPGGPAILLSVAGKEAGTEFRRYHPWVNYRFILENCRVGILQRDSGMHTLLGSTLAENPNTTTPPDRPQQHTFQVPSGLPQRHLKDPLRLALRQQSAPQTREPQEPKTPQFGG